MIDIGKKCGVCGSVIPITNIAVGKATFWNKYPITHFWCDSCESITVIRPVVLNKDMIKMLQSTMNLHHTLCENYSVYIKSEERK